MSVKVSSLVWACASLKDDVYELVAMLALADWADDNGEAFPSIKKLCAKIGMSERQWKYIKPRLIAKGYLEVFVGEGMRVGRNRTNLYKIKMPTDLQPVGSNGQAPSHGGEQHAPPCGDDNEKPCTRVHETPHGGAQPVHGGAQPPTDIRQYRSVSIEPSEIVLSQPSAAPNSFFSAKEEEKPKPDPKPPESPLVDPGFIEEQQLFNPDIDVQKEFKAFKKQQVANKRECYKTKFVEWLLKARKQRSVPKAKILRAD